MKHSPKPIALSPHELRRVAVVASVDPRTVSKRVSELNGELDEKSTRSTSSARVDDALRSCGHLPPAAPAASRGDGPRAA